LQLSASSSASGQSDGRSGEISGGTAFNIGGINFGTAQTAPVSAAGGAPLSSLRGSMDAYWIIGGAVAISLVVGYFALRR
jgi:hypothetical protein